MPSYVINIASRICIRVYLVDKDYKLHSHLPEYRKSWRKKMICSLNNLNRSPQNITITSRIHRILLTLLTDLEEHAPNSKYHILGCSISFKLPQ